MQERTQTSGLKWGLYGIAILQLWVCGCQSEAPDDDSSEQSGDDDASATPRPTALIQDLNTSPPPEGSRILTQGVIISTDSTGSFWIESSGGGQYSGIFVQLDDATSSATGDSIQVGSYVEIDGIFHVADGLRYLEVQDMLSGIQVLKTTAALPPPNVLQFKSLGQEPCSNLDVATLDAYTGTLVKLPAGTVASIPADCDTSAQPEVLYQLTTADGAVLVGADSAGEPAIPGDAEVLTGVVARRTGFYEIWATATHDYHASTLYTLNQTSPLSGTSVAVIGVVTGIASDGSFWIEDRQGGEFSGIFVSDPAKVGAAAHINPGTEVQVTGIFSRADDVAQLAIDEDGGVSVLEQKAGTPDPVVIYDVGQLELSGSNICSNSSTAALPYVGVLLQMQKSYVIDTTSICSSSPGLWEVQDANGSPYLVDDDIPYALVPTTHTYLTLTGILKYDGRKYALVPTGDDGIMFDYTAVNTGFENGQGLWYFYGMPGTISNWYPHSGYYSVLMQPGQYSDSEVQISTYVQQAKTYSLSAWVATNTKGVKLSVSEGSLNLASATVTPDIGYSQYTIKFKGGLDILYKITLYVPESDGWATLDDVFLQ